MGKQNVNDESTYEESESLPKSKRRNILGLSQKKKELQYDNILIQNRIMMLENEQTRLLKKIDVTRRRAE
jgi:hypothetical protein